jgi:acetyl-CoA carboxylase biotin carboxyl carrier protein
MAKPTDLAVDADLVRALAALLHETGLTEIEYAVGDRRIRVARDAVPYPVPPSAAPATAEPEPPATAIEPRGAVKSPMVGTAYLGPQPGAPPFVAIGDTVRDGQVLLLIEAMKVMNQIHAPAAGRVSQILVADGAPVEYGQVLLVLD